MMFLDFVAIFVTGLMIGNEFAIAAFIHPAISRLEPAAHLAAAKPIAATLGRVMPFWYALALLTILAELWFRRADHADLAFLTAASILWIGTIVFTIAALVPLNNRIATVDLTHPYPTWPDDRHHWDSRHAFRVAILTLAFVLLLVTILRS